MNNTKIKISFLIVLALAFGLGIYLKHLDYTENQRSYDIFSKNYIDKYERFQIDSVQLIQNIAAPINQIAFKNQSSSSAYLSASQGVEVHIVGLNWRGFFIDNKQNIVGTLREQFDAQFKQTINKIEFDPDFENCGHPDITFHIKNSPSFYQPGHISKFLAKKDPKPFKSFELNSCNKQKAIMDLWLVQFDLTFRIDPNDNYTKNKEREYSGKHPITGISSASIRDNKEFKDMRYDRMSLLLEFNPKDFHYLASNSSSKIEPLNQSPKIGIGAVECINVTKVGEKGQNNLANHLGVSIEPGESLPLYPSLSELINNISYKNKDDAMYRYGRNVPVEGLVTKFENIVDVCKDEAVIADPNFFNQKKYSIVDIKNLGSWKQKKSWMLGKSEFEADYYHAEFLIHLYVLGEWVVKDENITKFEARPPTSITRPSPLDYILPDFKLSIGGKLISALLLPIIILILLSFVFPPFGTIINKIIKGLFGA